MTVPPIMLVTLPRTGTINLSLGEEFLPTANVGTKERSFPYNCGVASLMTEALSKTPMIG
jgi:hypothetical protein